MRKGKPPERATAPNVIFPQPRLAFMHAHARRFAEKRITVGGSEALIVERVSAFMECGKDRGQHVVFIDTDGQSHIVHAGIERKRMGRAVETAALELKADRSKNLPADG